MESLPGSNHQSVPFSRTVLPIFIVTESASTPIFCFHAVWKVSFTFTFGGLTALTMAFSATRVSHVALPVVAASSELTSLLVIGVPASCGVNEPSPAPETEPSRSMVALLRTVS